MKETKQAAKNYAEALTELAKDLKDKENFLSEISQVNELIKNTPNAKKVFANPSVSKEEKKELLKKPLGNSLSTTTMNFTFLLIDKQRFNLLDEIQNELIKLVNKEKGIVEAEVASASELDTNTLENLKQKLETTFSRSEKVTIKPKVEPSLIGGLKVKINDLVYDGTIKGRLEDLKRGLQ